MTTVPAANRAKKLAIHLGDAASTKVDTMLTRQNLTGHTVSRRDVPAGSIGCLGSAELSAQVNMCFFTGAPINGPDIADLVDAESAARLFPLWDGAFAGIFWDAEQQVLVVATDCLGMQPLYMRQAEGELTLASETKAVSGAPDLAAWGAFLSIGHPIGQRSLVDGLSRVPPASVLTYDCNERRLSIRRYWEWPEPSAAWRNYDFLASLEQDMHAYADLAGPGTLLLSGGFDSRLLLFLLKRARIPVDALIVAHDDEHDDADGRFAESVATSAGVPFRKECPTSGFFSSFAYLEYLAAIDAGFPTLDLFIAKVASQIESTAVWDGLIPGFVFIPAHQPEGGFDTYQRQEIRGWDSATWRAAQHVFTPDIVEVMFEGFQEDLRAELSLLPRNAHGLSRFVLENRARNRAGMNPHKVYTNTAIPLTPGIAKDFMTHAAMIPFVEKQDGQFYRSMFAQLDKRALEVPFLSGGDLMKGGRANSTYYREWLRIEYSRYRARYPSLFRGKGQIRSRRSTFLDERLLEMDDFLNPDIRDKLKAGDADQYATWKLLFHWKAWQWVHEDRLETVLG